MTQVSELEKCVLRLVRIYPDRTAADIAKISDMPSMAVVLRILEGLAEKRLVKNIDEHNSEKLAFKSIWRVY